jgi:hypothetical protein
MPTLPKRQRSSKSSSKSKSSVSSSSATHSSRSQESLGNLTEMFKRSVHLKSTKSKRIKPAPADTLANLFSKATLTERKTRPSGLNTSLIIHAPNSSKRVTRSINKMDTSVAAPVRTRKKVHRSVPMQVNSAHSSANRPASHVSSMHISPKRSSSPHRSSSRGGAANTVIAGFKKTGGDSLGNMFQGLANSSVRGLDSVANSVTSIGNNMSSKIQGAMHMGGRSCNEEKCSEGGKRRKSGKRTKPHKKH